MRRNLRAGCAGLWLCFTLCTGSSGAGVLLPNGDQVQVNTYTTGAQRRAVAAHDGQGRFVVVWSSVGSFGSDSSGLSVDAQRFGADGALLGGELQVNTYTPNHQDRPSVAATPQGEFVVAWQSLGSSGSDSSLYSVQAQLFDSGGLPAGPQFQVNTYTTSGQASPAVAVYPDGRFMVVWDSQGSFGSDTSVRSIQARLYAADGSPLGSEQQVNTYTTDEQFGPAVAATEEGFLVAWSSIGSFGSDVSSRSVQAQRFSEDALPLGGQFQVNTYTTGSQYNPDVAAGPGGRVVLVWSSDGSNGTDLDHAIITQILGPDGTFLAHEAQVNDYTLGVQAQPAVAVGPDGRFLVVWRSGDLFDNGPDGNLGGISGRLLATDGTPLGGELVVNTYTTGNQYTPAVTVSPQCGFVVTWQSPGSFGTDLLAESVQAQRYEACPLFADGFEAGGTGAWSGATP